MQLLNFRAVFQDFYMSKHAPTYLSGVNWIVLREMINFDLSDIWKRAYLNLQWDEVKHIRWSENVEEGAMMGQGLQSRRAEALRESLLIHSGKVDSSLVMIRASFDLTKLVHWITQILNLGFDIMRLSAHLVAQNFVLSIPIAGPHACSATRLVSSLINSPTAAHGYIWSHRFRTRYFYPAARKFDP